MNEREAEDRALDEFNKTPWEDEPLSTMNNHSAAFRAGFRAGQEHKKTDKAEFLRGWDAAKEESRMLAERSAPNPGQAKGIPEPALRADSPLGIELSKIRDRLDALENGYKGLADRLGVGGVRGT